MAATRRPPTDDARCTAHTRTGARCRKTKRVGLQVCGDHGGLTPASARKSELIKAELKIREHRRFAEPISPEDWEANPINSFEMEFRRTIAWIRYYEECVEKLKDDHALIWGLTKREDHFGEDGYAGKGDTEEAKPNILIELLFRERKHLHELQKTWIGARLDMKKIEMEKEIMDRLELTITNLVTGFGLDPQDPEVRRKVRVAMIPVAA